jgi:hypothetical protein
MERQIVEEKHCFGCQSLYMKPFTTNLLTVFFFCLAGGQWLKPVSPESMMLPTINTWLSHGGGGGGVAGRVQSPSSFGGAAGLNANGTLNHLVLHGEGKRLS